MHAQKKKSRSHLWMSLMMQWEVYDIIKSAVEGMSLKPLADEVGSAQAALGMRPRVQQLSKEKHQWDWAVSWTSHSFHRTGFTWKRHRQTNWIFRPGIWQIFPARSVKWACNFKENNWFIANDKIQAFKRTLEYWKPCLRHYELGSFLLKLFWWARLWCYWMRWFDFA